MSACWLCGDPRSREVLAATMTGSLASEDLKISDAHYGRTARLVRCLACGFRYADPLPAPDLVELYRGLEDPEYLEGGEWRIRPFRQIVGVCRRLHPGARTLLDIGAGTGLLCRAARDAGLEATGLEPSAWGAGVAREAPGVEVLEGTFPDARLAGRRFDIITLVDVIEHVADPMRLLQDVAAALAPGGLVVITTPDVGSLAARALGRRWWHYRVAHVCFFDRRTMNRALAGAGLDLVRRERYRWCFSIGYLAERLERYLPVGPLRRGLLRLAPGRALMEWTVPVNLHDSFTFYARRPGAGEQT